MTGVQTCALPICVTELVLGGPGVCGEVLPSWCSVVPGCVGKCDRAGARWSREVGGVFGSVGFSRLGLVLWFFGLGPSRNARGTSCGLLSWGRAGMLGVRVVGWGGRGNAAVAWRGVLKSARCLCKVWVQHFLFPFRQPN